jgi:hypothetical protein
MTETSGGENGPKILNFPHGDKFFPPTARIRALYFYGPLIKPPGASVTISPCYEHIFETPATEAEARAFIAGIANSGGFTTSVTGGYLYVPWPCVVYYDLVKSA